MRPANLDPIAADEDPRDAVDVPGRPDAILTGLVWLAAVSGLGLYVAAHWVPSLAHLAGP